MRRQLIEKKLDDRARWRGLFFDEVKVNEGLVFDPSTWELVGFTDLGSEELDLEGLLCDGNSTSDKKCDDGLATHVMQFFLTSLFANFECPCAYFLTKGIKSPKLNKLFWQGVSMLHSHGFEVLLVCCDGASSNRASIKMNTEQGGALSVGYHFFSRHSLFFMSDPPHIIKKLRNNLSSSGLGKKCSRLLKRNGSLILWKHAEAVNEREKARRARYTKLTNAHINIDNLSKMRVKLAVETLSREVANDMAMNDHYATFETQQYINICSDMFHAFNSRIPLSSPEDERISILNGAMGYFTSWKASLSTEDKKIQNKSFITQETISRKCLIFTNTVHSVIFKFFQVSYISIACFELSRIL